MRKNMSNVHHHSSKVSNGFSTLLIVLLIAMILATTLVGVILINRFVTQRSLTMQYSQRAYYAAEGAIQETSTVMNQFPDWPPKLPYHDSYKLGEVSITRSITVNATTGKYQIEIRAQDKQAKRRLVAEYSRLGEAEEIIEETDADIMLVIDTSGSMKPAIERLKTAVVGLLQSDVITVVDRVGLVHFAYSATLDSGLTTNIPALIAKIQGFVADATTNTPDGLLKAGVELDQHGRSETQKFVVLFSDGVPSRSRDQAGVVECIADACIDYTSVENYAPAGGGHRCSDDSIRVAKNLKQKGYQIISVYYDNAPPNPSCGVVELTQELGRKTMQEIASKSEWYFETDDPDELHDIFKSVSTQIKQGKSEFLQYREVDPI